MKLYYFETINPQKACAVAKYLDSPVEFVRIDLSKGQHKSPDYLAGQAGDILGDSGKKFPIGQSPGYLQSQACNMVLDQAKKLRMAL